jgi:hypothetical protein
MELSGKSKLGRGEKNVRTAEHQRASKHVRDGLMVKKKEREKARLEEVRTSSREREMRVDMDDIG